MKPHVTSQRVNDESTSTVKVQSARSKFLATWLMVAATSAVALGTGGGSGPIGPSPLPGMSNFIDWDLPSLTPVNAGQCPSAIGAITRFPVDQPGGVDPVYYITLCPQSFTDPNRLGPTFVELRTEMHPQPAIWRAWNIGESPMPDIIDPALLELGDAPAITGGMRLSGTSRAFIRTQSEIVRLNLTSVPAVRTRWQDSLLDTDPAAQSDVALVERSGGYVDVWSAINSTTTNPGSIAVPPVLPTFSGLPPGMLQRLTVANSSNTATVTRYAVDGGAGLHYLSGVVHFEGKIYFSEGAGATDADNRGNSIGVLDPASGHVHRFSLSSLTATLPVSGPRQLSVDYSTRTIWAVTQSGHVVSLKPESTCGSGLPKTAQMAAFFIPTPGSDPRGVSPAGGIVGFTESGFGLPPNGKKIGLLVPDKNTDKITATEETVNKTTFCLLGTTDMVHPDQGTIQGVEKSSPTVPSGRFLETLLPDTGDFPLGILRDPFSPAGAFYVAVSLGGLTNHRLSRVEFATDPDPTPMPDITLPGLAVAPNTEPGLVTGGGTLGTDPAAVDLGDLLQDPDAWAPGGGNANFDLSLYRQWNGGTVSGRLSYVNKLTGDTVKSTAITGFATNGRTATISGTCTNTKAPLPPVPCTFEITVEDNGYPGKTRDTFKISGIGFLANQGTLTGGNVYVHRRR